MSLNTNKILDISSILTMVADSKNYKIIYQNKKVDKLLGNLLNKSIIEIFEKENIEEFINKNKTSNSVKTFYYLIDDFYFIINISVFTEDENNYILINGTNITDFVYDGSIALTDEVDESGIYLESSGNTKLKVQLNNLKLANNYFSIAYIDLVNHDKLDGDSLKDFYDTVQSSIRETDIFSHEKDGYIIIFPKCPLDVAKSIMSTINNKINILNNTTNDLINIKYNLMEINQENVEIKEDIIKKLKSF